jgi:hypothetical protein
MEKVDTFLHYAPLLPTVYEIGQPKKGGGKIKATALSTGGTTRFDFRKGPPYQ